MLITIEISHPMQLKPGRYKSRVVTRLWWLWFAVALVHVSAIEYSETAWKWDGA